jgi:hypothetical protein
MALGLFLVFNRWQAKTEQAALAGRERIRKSRRKHPDRGTAKLTSRSHQNFRNSFYTIAGFFQDAKERNLKYRQVSAATKWRAKLNKL